ncbi:hypothetical protein [Flavobacterium sp.]|uniref:hypothetical protein n=1 Tax=Flavobacterium sp. TaxID=239 RepID=UPI00375280D9
MVDVGWDDPFDAIVKTNYVDEVAPFSNVADMLVVNPTDEVITRLQLMSQNDMKAILHLNKLFFYHAGTGGPSGELYDLRSDYKNRWDTFMATNNLSVNSSFIQAFYIGEEPTWNSISFSELKLATDYVKSTLPNVPIMIIEAYPIINDLQVPTTVDWIGFDHYFIKDPKNNGEFRNELNIIKSKRSTLSQKVVLVMDAHYISALHGNIGGITELEMASVATSYYDLANSDPAVVALLGYFWPGGVDDPSAKGARGLPQNAKDEITKIGKLITGK